MAGTVITNSPNISLLDSRIIADLCEGIFYVDLSPSVYIGSGADNVLGANVQITNPLGVIVKPYGSNYEISPALSGGMDAAVSFAVPTQGGGYQLGSYTIDVKLFDADGTAYTVSKLVNLCAPDQSNPSRKYGSLSATLKGVCSSGKMYVIVDNAPNYKGATVESQVNDFTLEYPTSSGVADLETSQTNFTVVLYEGVYKINGTICATYNLTDNVYVKVNYKVKKSKDQKCIIDLCCVYSQLEMLDTKRNSDCTDAEKEQTANVIIDSLFLLRKAELAASCGEDPSSSIEELEALLGCKCTCNCNEGTPIINNEPTGDFSIVGCNVSHETVGLTKIYTINNYAYAVTITGNGGALTITSGTLDGCVITRNIEFNISVVYTQIKAQINDANEWAFWGEVISRPLDAIDPTCIGLTYTQWRVLSWPDRIQAIINAFCNRGGLCKARVTNAKAEQVASAIVYGWNEVGVSSVDLYFDGVLIANVLAGVLTYSHPFNPPVDTRHTFAIVPKCVDGSSGTSVGGTIESFARTFVAPPQVYTPYLNQTVPYDLTTNLLPLPLGISTEWHTANNTDAISLVADPTNALGGVYFVFGKDSNGFYSEGVQVQLTANVTGSCSAPQNLTIIPAYGSNLIQFQSAAYPPPANSYTVKRRLSSDADIAGNYTTIGSPVWNASASRWVINDSTAASNVLYTYRVFSNCGSTAPYIDKEYAAIVCPIVSLVPKVTEVDYSFPDIGGEVDKIEVIIYSDNGITVEHTDTHLPAFSDPVVGSFVYLNPNKTYYVGVKAYIGTYVKSCTLEPITTLHDTATLTVDYIAGTWLASLNNVLSEDVIVKTAVATGSTDVCVTPLQTDTVVSDIVISAGEFAAQDETNGLDYLSIYYKITNSVTIDGFGALVDGATFSLGGATVTLKINHIVCGYYPA